MRLWPARSRRSGQKGRPFGERTGANMIAPLRSRRSQTQGCGASRSLRRSNLCLDRCPRQDSNLRARLRRGLLCMALTSGNMLAEILSGRVWGAARRRSAAKASARQFALRCMIDTRASVRRAAPPLAIRQTRMKIRSSPPAMPTQAESDIGQPRQPHTWPHTDHPVWTQHRRPP
jgi:hypothetical protein